MSNTHEHLEQAEHAEHASHDPFNQRVAVTMAIVAAILATISMVGHRTHNRVLQLQGDANRLLGDVNRVLGDVNRRMGEANRIGTEAASAEVEKSNLFAWYQAKRLRQSQLETSATLLELIPSVEPPSKDADPETKKRAAAQAEARKQAIADAKKRAADYKTSNKDRDNLPDLIKRGDEAGARAEKLRGEATKVREQAEKAREEAVAFRKQAAERKLEAEHVHHQANRFDIAHLSSEIALVLCSIALLTKKKGFWFAGIVAAVLALGLLASGYAIPHEDHDQHEAAPTATEHDHPHEAAPAPPKDHH